jgi:hypothetical protein
VPPTAERFFREVEDRANASYPEGRLGQGLPAITIAYPRPGGITADGNGLQAARSQRCG